MAWTFLYRLTVQASLRWGRTCATRGENLIFDERRELEPDWIENVPQAKNGCQ